MINKSLNSKTNGNCVEKIFRVGKAVDDSLKLMRESLVHETKQQKCFSKVRRDFIIIERNLPQRRTFNILQINLTLVQVVEQLRIYSCQNVSKGDNLYSFQTSIIRDSFIRVHFFFWKIYAEILATYFNCRYSFISFKCNLNIKLREDIWYLGYVVT